MEVGGGVRVGVGVATAGPAGAPGIWDGTARVGRGRWGGPEDVGVAEGAEGAVTGGGASGAAGVAGAAGS